MSTEKQQNIVELDVREQLRNKIEPLQLIMSTVKSLKPDDIFLLHATFKPVPLLTAMKAKGFACEVEQLEKEHWVVRFYKKGERQ